MNQMTDEEYEAFLKTLSEKELRDFIKVVKFMSDNSIDELHSDVEDDELAEEFYSSNPFVIDEEEESAVAVAAVPSAPAPSPEQTNSD